MSAPKRSTASLLTGLFLVSGLLGFLAISAVISGAIDRLTPSEGYTVRFTLERGAPGVKPGSDVTMGGQPVGRVTGVSFVTSDAGVATGIDVDVNVESRYTLFTDARFVLVRPLIGEGGTLNIISAGTSEAGPLAPGSTIDASIGIPTFLADAGYGDTQVAQVQGMLADGAAFMGRAADMAERLDADVSAITDDAKSFSRTLRQTSEDVQQRWPELNEEAMAALAGLREAGDGIGRVISESEGLVAEVRDAVREGSPRVQSTLAAAQRIAERFEGEHTDAAIAALDDIGLAAADLAQLADRADRLLAEESPAISRSLANARLASDQLRQASYEIRRNPWRILARPDTKELEGELIYDAARSHAEAASDLRDAAASLDAVLSAAEPNEADNTQVGEHDRLRESLAEAMDRYEAAQDRLLELIEPE
ncbi:MAG: MlaD family protein [Planctomycetota bacterium]